MADHAVSGTGWSAFQGIANKLATMASIVVVARYLGPVDYGASGLVQGIGGFLVLLPPLVMGDVLIAHERHLGSVRGVARRVVLTSAIASSATIALSIPVFVGLYPKFPGSTLAALLLVFAVRPVADAFCVIPLTRLRSGLRFRVIAAIDGSVQLLATLASIAMAMSGAGALSLIMPQAVASALKAILYLATSRDPGPTSTAAVTGRRARAWGRRLRRQFVVAALAQHAHTLISNLPMLVLARISSDEQTGIYTFAFYLSVQATFVISYQVAAVLQPIFAKLGHDHERQAKGFVRVIAAVGALAVPLALLQAVLAEPLLRILFGEKWMSAVPTLAALSVGQAFFFAVAPIMAMLRAQGRFRVLLVWQLLQLVLSIGLYCLAASGGALPVAIVDTCVWGLSVPVMAWVCVRGRGVAVPEALRPVVAPWLTALPIALLSWVVWQLLRPWEYPGAAVSVFIVGPLAGLASLAAVRVSQPTTYAELAPMVSRAAGAFARLPRGAVARLTRSKP
jgi:PST family polysaccharide transporter